MEKTRKILIAEDSPTQALRLQMILEDRGHIILHGSNGKEALALIDENNPPDIIITDIVMPVMDGYELCTIVKQNEKTKEIPVILLTQLSNPDDVIKGLQAGADNFISKPYSETFLFERISDIMLNRELRKRSLNLDIEMDIYFGGQKFKLNSNRLQILDLLLSTYYNAINKNKELEEKNMELKKLHKELKIRNIQLNKLNDEKNQLLGIAAHDLRSPLCTVTSYFDLVSQLIDENVISDQEQIFSTINETLDFMLNLVSDVLDYTKIESGKIDLKYEEFNLVTFMDKAIELNNILSAQKHIRIIPQYSHKPIRTKADKNKIKQVMDNLLSNAVKYSESNTNVSVYLKATENEIEVVVADQGQGIPEDELGKLFQPFVTTTVRSTAGEKSTGLGLASVKKIVETHGGRIWVKSERGVGSQFHFTIPCVMDTVSPHHKNTEKASLADEKSGAQNLKILIAEDEETADRHLSIVLKDINSEILHAKSGKEAIEICLNNPDTDLILMDIKMPNMNGYEATKKIREFNKEVVIIAQTAYALPGDYERAIEAGCNDYISKPIDKNELLDMIRRLI